MIQPYYQSENVTLYNADCLEVLPQLEGVDAVVTDPPYGIAQHRGGLRRASCPGLPRVALVGDTEPFDPAAWLSLGLPIIMWGANHYADKLPPSAGWLVWDKYENGTSLTFSDGELAWTNILGVVRLCHHKWRGMIKASERDTRREHPTQKPIALMEWCMDITGISENATVLDGYMGSGTTGVACIRTGRKFIGIEISEEYCAIAEKRIREAEAQLALQM